MANLLQRAETLFAYLKTGGLPSGGVYGAYLVASTTGVQRRRDAERPPLT
jgi:hypothetical protein